jgi:archaellum component FlaG (FlaF/FlaG flagellin family)
MDGPAFGGRMAGIAAGLVVVLVSGCALFRPGTPGQELPADPDAITVVVRNNLTPPTTLTVYMVTDAGTSTRLGQVTGVTTERFTARVPPVGRARLYARTSDGGERNSNAVSLRPGQVLEWDVFANVISERFGGRAVLPSPARLAGR